MTVRTESGISERRVGRYVLDDLVAENRGTSLWRATDPALQRPVGARLMPLSDPRAEVLRDAARRAAGVHDRRLVRVLDVVETDHNLAVITEWVSGTSWSELLTERWSAPEATVVALEIGRALESAHQAGVTHGRIRPDSVIITDTREVRLRGLGVEAVVWGVDPPGDPRASDLHGIGALLYVGLTRRWPSAPGRTEIVDGLEPAPTANGFTPVPSHLAADIPASLDDIVRRSVLTVAPPNQLAYASVSECVRALERASDMFQSDESASSYSEEAESRTDRLVGRLSTVAVFLFAATGLLLLMWQFFMNRPADEPLQMAEPVAEKPQLPAFEAPLAETSLPIVSARAFDPLGDKTESSRLVKKAIDAKKGSSWTTEAYRSADMSSKGGVGLLLDLGAVRPVRALELQLFGTGTDFEILTSRKKPKSLDAFHKVVGVTGAGDSITVRTPKPVDARYVLVWLTGLPYDGSYYVGGIRDVKIVG